MATIARTTLLLFASLVMTTASIYAVSELAFETGSYWVPGTNSSRSVANYAGESGIRFVRLRGTSVAEAAAPAR